MISWSARRRLFYSTLLLLTILAAVGFGLYLWWPKSSCFDGRLNQGEAGVDCGGPCSAVCPSEVKRLLPVWTRVLATAPGRYEASALVQNPNPTFGLRSFRYALRLVDADNLLVNLAHGETFVRPGETFVIFKTDLNAGRRLPVRATLEVLDAPRWFRAPTAPPPSPITWRVIGFENGAVPRLRAEMSNTGLNELKEVEVVAVLSDDKGNALAVSSTFLPTLAGEASTELIFTWPRVLAKEPATIELYPHFPLSNPQ